MHLVLEVAGAAAIAGGRPRRLQQHRFAASALRAASSDRR
jgi:hypothetical protein